MSTRPDTQRSNAWANRALRPLRGALALLVAMGLVLAGLTATAPKAQADVLDNGFDYTFLVNDVRDVADTSPGDGVCSTRFTDGTPATPTCTLYAAIQEANALPAGASILIAPAPSIRQLNGSSASSGLIEIDWNTTNNPTPQVPNMLASSAAFTAAAGLAATIDNDTTARYWVQHSNVTMDFQQRLGWTITSASSPVILLFSGQDQTMRNFTKLTSGEGGVYVGSTAVNFSMINGLAGNTTTPPASPANYAMERAVVVVEGATNTKISNVTFQRNYWDAIGLAAASNTSLVINGLSIDRSIWDQPANAGGYDPAYSYFLRNYTTAVSGTNISITNSSISNWGADGGDTDNIYLNGGTWTNVVLRGNTFTGSVDNAVNPIQLNGIGATNTLVAENTFRYVGTKITSAAVRAWVYNNGSTNGVTIRDNKVIGGGNTTNFANAATTTSTSTLPIFRNTMSGVGYGTTATNENAVGATYNNIYNSGNGTIRTAYPTQATVISTPPQTCQIDITVNPPATNAGGTAIPTDPIYVDAYLGRTTANGGDNAGLEQYLGRIVTTQSALTPARTFSLPFTGVGDGNVVRLQTTEVATGRTSQYSRTVVASGLDTCGPEAWVKQGGWFNENGTITSSQEDPTSYREVRFDIATSEALGGAGLTAGNITFSGTAPGQQVVSLTQLTPTTWTLIAKANGTGTIVPSIAAGAVADPSGNPNTGASNTTTAPIDFSGFTDVDQSVGVPGASLDSSVLYNSPLAITAPSPLQLTVAEPGTTTSAITVSNTTVDANGRVVKAPSSPITFTQQWSGLVSDPSLPVPPGQTADSIAKALPTHPELDAAQPTMDSIDRTVDIPIQAIDNHIVDGTRQATLDFAVTSEDPEFDGLLLSTAAVTVTDDDQPVANASTLAVTADNAPADSTTVNSAVTTVRNAAADPVSNAAVVFSIPTGVTWVGPDGTPGTGDDVPGGPGVTATILSGTAGTAQLDLISATGGGYSIGASVNGSEAVSGSPQTVTFSGVPVDTTNPATGFTVSGGSVVADGTATHTITVTLRDLAGQPATGRESALSATAAPSTGVTIGAFAPTATPGEYQATVSSTTIGAKTVSVTLDDGTARPISMLAGGSATATFVAGAPVVGPGLSSIAIDDDSDRLSDGTAYHQVTVVLADGSANPVTGAAAQLTSSVAGSPSGVTVSAFVESATPGTYTALVRSTLAGGQDVTAVFGGSTTIGTVTANFAAGAVDLGNPGSAYSVSTGNQTVGTGQHTITVTLADSNGNPVSGQSAALNATPSASLGTGSITGFVQTAPGTYTATVTSTVAGAKSITVRFGVSAVTLAGNGTAQFVAGAVDLGNPASVYSVTGGDVEAGSGRHSVTVRLADALGNPVPGQAGSLVGSTTDDLGSGGITGFTETVPGTYVATVTSTVTGAKAIEVFFNAAPVTLSGNGTASFASSGVDPDNIGTRYTVTTGDQPVGTGSHTVTVTLADALGNPVANQSAGIKASTTSDLGTGGITAFTETGTSGTYTATVTSSVAGQKTIVATFGADDLTVLLVGNDIASFVAGAVDLGPGASAYSVSAGTRPVGTAQHTVTVTLQDSLGNPISGREGDLSATPSDDLGTGGITAFAETTTPGTYTATITSTVAGAKAIEVLLSGSSVLLSGNGTATFAAGPVDLSAPGSVYSVTGGDVSVAGGTHTVSVTLTDSFGNPVAGQAGTLIAKTTDPLGSGAITPVRETAPGSYEATVTSSVAGAKTIAVELGGTAVTLSGNAVASFIAGGVDVTNPGTRYSVSTGGQPVGTGTHTITVTLADANGNPVSGQALGLTADTAADLGAGDFTDFAETGTAGTYTATVSSTLIGAKPITVEFGGSSVIAGGNATATFTAGAVDLNAPGTGYSVSSGQVSVDGGSHRVTVTLTDQYGNPVAGAVASVLAETSASLGSGQITGFVEATPGTYTATITSSVAGDKPIDATYSGSQLTLRGNGVASFVAGGVDVGNAGTRFSVSTGDQTVGTGSHTITVTLADANGNPVTGAVAGLTATPGGDLGAGGISAFAETTTLGTYTATVTSTSAGNKTITVGYGGSAVTAGGNAIASFVAGAVDPTSESTGYEVTTGSVSIDGGSHRVTAYLTDVYGNPVSGLAANLTATPDTDLGGGGITGFVEQTPGTYTATITSTVAGDKTIVVDYSGTTLQLFGNGVAVFGAGAVDLTAPGTAYSVSTGDQLVQTGTHTITVTLSDSVGNPVSGEQLSLAAATDDPIGTGNITAFEETATPGTYTATITSSISGPKNITANYGVGSVSSIFGLPLQPSGNVVANFVAGPVDLTAPGTVFSVSTGDQAVTSGSHTVTVTLSDSLGNPVSGQEAQLAGDTADSLGSGDIADFVESSTPGTYTAAVTSSVAGAKTIAVTYNGSAVTASGNTVASFVAGPVDTTAPGTTFSVSTGDQTVGTGSHTVTATLVDADGNPVSGQEAQLAGDTADSLGSGDIADFVETATPGTYTATVTSTSAGAKTIAVTYNGTTLSPTGNTVASFVAGAVDLANPGTGFSVSTGNQPVGTGSHTVTVTLVDQYGNPVPGQLAQLAPRTGDDLGSGGFSAFAETSPGTYAATVGSSIAGTKTIEVTFGGSVVTADGNTVATFVAGGVDLTNPGTGYSVSTGDQPVGTGSHTVTVTLADSLGNPVAGQAAQLRASTAGSLGSGMITGFVASGAAGTYTATVTSTVAGAKAITVTYDDSDISAAGNDTATFSVGAVDLTAPGTGFSVSSGDATVGTGSHLITITLTDQYGNPVPGQAGELTAQSGASLGTGGVTAVTETSTPGTYTATVTSSVSGAKAITADFDSSSLTARGNATASFVAGGVDPTAPGTAFTVSTGTQPVGAGSHTVTATLVDSLGNPVSGQAAGLTGSTADALGGGRISEFAETSTPGTYTATVTSTVAGSKVIAVRFGGSTLTVSGNDTAVFGIGAVDPANPLTGFSVSAGSVPVGSGTHTITVTLVDQFDNPEPGLEASLVAKTTGSLGGGAIGAFTETATPGTYTATVSSTVAGSMPITVEYSGSALTARGNASALFVAGPVDLTKSTLTATSPVPADGTTASTVTLRLVDQYGNPVTAPSTVVFGTTLGTLGTVSSDGAGSYTVLLRSDRVGTATINATVDGAPLPMTVDVTFSDITAPQTPVIDPSDGKTVTGCAEPGSTIEIRNSAGAVIGTGTAGADCRFAISLQPPLGPGESISVTAIDPSGNVSAAATLRIGLISMDLSQASLRQGGQQTATGHNFQPGEHVAGVLNSTPVDLGTQVADANGEVVFAITLPADIEIGQHSVTLTGDFSGTVSETFMVVAPPATIAATGLNILMPVLIGGVAAIVLGLALVLIRRRREAGQL